MGGGGGAQVYRFASGLVFSGVGGLLKELRGVWDC